VLLHLGALALSVFVAAWRLGVADAASDEFTYRRCGLLAVTARSLACNPEHPPLAKELIGLSSWLFGDTVLGARIAVAVVAVATALFVYLFVREVRGWRWGLGAGLLWAALPQWGMENGVALEAVRIDRYALLDPFLACAVAAAMWAGWRWCQGGRGALWAAATGAACGAAACCKVPGLLIIPVVAGAPLIAGFRRGVKRGAIEASSAMGGAVVLVVASYAPFGPSAALHQVRTMLAFQSAHAAHGTASTFETHYSLHAPWWSDLAYALEGLSWPVAIALCVGTIAAIASRSRPALYALGASASIFVFLAFATHLSLPYYWIDWEPGLVVASVFGLTELALGPHWRRALAGVVALVLASGCIATIVSVATLRSGPYRQAASEIACRSHCTVLYVANAGDLEQWLGRRHVFQARAGMGDILLTNGTHTVGLSNSSSAVAASRLALPEYVVVDPSSDLAAHVFAARTRRFELAATSLGYVRVPGTGRLEVWVRKAPLRGSSPPRRRGAPLPPRGAR
jgi:4-amino-4-deoxy-L-arabinose transferase-like glycosyltransferase